MEYIPSIEVPDGCAASEGIGSETLVGRIVGTDKPMPLSFGERLRTVRYGRCTAFDAIEDSRLSAHFVGQDPDFILPDGCHQAVEADRIGSPHGGRIPCRVPMGGQSIKALIDSLGTIHFRRWGMHAPESLFHWRIDKSNVDSFRLGTSSSSVMGSVRDYKIGELLVRQIVTVRKSANAGSAGKVLLCSKAYRLPEMGSSLRPEKHLGESSFGRPCSDPGHTGTLCC